MAYHFRVLVVRPLLSCLEDIVSVGMFDRCFGCEIGVKRVHMVEFGRIKVV